MKRAPEGRQNLAQHVSAGITHDRWPQPRRGGTHLDDSTCSGSFRPYGAGPDPARFPGLVPWATIFRASGAAHRKKCSLAFRPAPGVTTDCLAGLPTDVTTHIAAS